MIATEQQSAILSDLMGVAEDIPTLKMPTALMPESSGVFLRYGAISAMPGASNAIMDANLDLVPTPDGNPVIHFHRHVSGEGVETLFCYTKDHVYKWVETSKEYELFFTCSSSCTMWNTASHAGKVVSTNNVDYVQVWDELTQGVAFAPLDTESGLDLDGGTTYLTKAAYVVSYENYVIFGDTTEGGTHNPNRIRWSAYGDLTDYDTEGNTDTGAKDFEADYGPLKGFGHYTYQGADLLIVFKERTYFPMWLVVSEYVWSIGNAQGNIGLLASHSVVNDSEGNLYWIGSDYAVHQFRVGILSRRIDKTVKAINIELQDNIEATYIPKYNQIWWSIPSSTTSTGNDEIIAWNIHYKIWHHYPFSYRALGQWSQQTSYTIDGLDALSETIDGLDAAMPTIDYVEGMAGFPLDIVSDESGYVYSAHTAETDMGNDVTRYFVLSTMLTEALSLHLFKRLSRIKHYLMGRLTTATLDFSLKRDNETSWQSIGSISQESAQEIFDIDQTPDHRAKHFLIRGQSNDYFDYLGCLFEFTMDGFF